MKKKCQFLRIHKKRAKLQFFFEIYKFICTFAENLLKMIIGFLISVLSLTFSVTSSSSVEVSGLVPEGVEVTYQRSGTTGQKGQMTAGNSTLLCVSGMDGCVIDSVALQMRSNKSAGAGSLQMLIGEKEVWSIEDTDFANVAWNGSFTNAWVKISRWIGEKVGVGEQIDVLIEASKNSLYIDSYTFYYTVPPPQAYEVQFISGIGVDPPILSEESPCMGVVLPQGIDTLDWRFLGWSEHEVMDTDTCPRLYMSGECYYPKTNCRLWAVYSDTEQSMQMKEMVSGEYVMAHKELKVAMHGAIEGVHVHTAAVGLQQEDGWYELVSSVSDDMVYAVEFLTDSTLTIQHVRSGDFIGYRDDKLRAQQSIWYYRILADYSLCIYHPRSKNVGMLFFGLGADGMASDIVVYSAHVKLESVKENGTCLFPVKKQFFTTWPFGKYDAIEDVILPDFIDENYHYIWHMGTYNLHIQNGKKYLLLR